MKLGVTIPLYNEEKFIEKTLIALRDQTDKDFRVFLCDNNSTDSSVKLINDFISSNKLDWFVVSETQKGTGAASDTGVRAAISAGCDVVLRTDADSLPHRDWVERMRAKFASDERIAMVSGLSIPIRSEVSSFNFWSYRFFAWIATMFGVFRASNYGGGARSIYIMAAGNNMAVRGNYYIEAGGFPRTTIEQAHEDRELVNQMRRHGMKVVRDRSAVVEVSARRIEAWGIVRSLEWYRSHRKPEQNVDIR
ncbi:MAG: hypothetical protein RLZZ400_253 [Actinomycetota bacterium]